MTDKIKEALENIEFQILKHRELRQEHNYVSTITPAIEAAISAVKTIRNALQAQEWQPIETCPDDGKSVLLAYKNSMKKYCNPNDHIPDWCFEARPYCIKGSGGAKSWHSDATHWMPLPQPPKVKNDSTKNT